MHFKGLDLNLLIALDALLSEKNVTRAAERMNISQPGMSAVLHKLRYHFSDQLLDRVGRRLELTPRGRSLAQPVKAILLDIGKLSRGPDVFDPAEAQRVFRVCSTTFCSDLLAVPTIRMLETVAPHISVQFDDLLPDTFSRLADGQADLAISVAQQSIMDPTSQGEPMSALDFFSDRLVLIVAKENRAVGPTITLDHLCSMPYVETRFGSQTATIGEQAWRRQRQQPRVRAWFPTFQLTLEAVAQTDMVGMVPSKLVAIHRESAVRMLPIPFEVPPLNERLFWHQRNDRDAGHRWFRDVLQSVALELRLTDTPGNLLSIRASANGQSSTEPAPEIVGAERRSRV